MERTRFAATSRMPTVIWVGSPACWPKQATNLDLMSRRPLYGTSAHTMPIGSRPFCAWGQAGEARPAISNAVTLRNLAPPSPAGFFFQRPRSRNWLCRTASESWRFALCCVMAFYEPALQSRVYRRQAALARERAAALYGGDLRDGWLGIAKSYDELAATAEAQEARPSGL